MKIPAHACSRWCCVVCHHDTRTHRSPCIDTSTAPAPVIPISGRCRWHDAGRLCNGTCRTCDKVITDKQEQLGADTVADRLRLIASRPAA